MATTGRPHVLIERDPQRFEIACWWAFTEMGLGPFDAARRALLAVKSGPIRMEDVEVRDLKALGVRHHFVIAAADAERDEGSPLQ